MANMKRYQHTIRGEVVFEGEGIHTGCYTRVRVTPAEENTGYVFIKKKGDEEIKIPALLANVVDTYYCTTLGIGEDKIRTVEHLLAALYALEIDNVKIYIEGEEVPFLDGSALPFLEKIRSVGEREQNSPRKYFFLDRNMRFEDPSKKVEMLATPYDEFRVTALVDFDTQFKITQYGEMYNLGEFADSIAPAHSFVLLKDILALYEKNMIRGGEYSNCRVIIDHVPTDDEISRLKKIFNIPDHLINNNVFESKIFSVEKPLFENEAARHKILDVVGDMALLGVALRAHILAARPSHSTNIAFAKELLKVYHQIINRGPIYDPSKPPIYDINDILKILPHKYPFIFVDKIIELSETHVVGIKNVTINEHFFTGHFPDNPTLPGVVIVEALAQTGGIFMLTKVDNPHIYDTYFLKISEFKFKKKCVPGDTLIMYLELLSPIRRGLCHMYGRVYVGGEIAAEGELLAQIVKKQSNVKKAQHQ